MKANYEGTLEGSEMFFTYASKKAREMFFYPICIGYYKCDTSYTVNRKSYDSFLLLYVHSGEGYLEQDGVKTHIPANRIIFIDCYKQHRYYTKTGWEISWLHFDGAQSRAYYDECTKEGVCMRPYNTLIIENTLSKILEMYKLKIDLSEAIISKYITDLLTEVYLSSMNSNSKERSVDIVQDTIAYISENVDKQISIDELAERVSFSKFHFIRVFKKATGNTPHECIVKIRIDVAKFLLSSTNAPIKEISFRSGFNNDSSFCTVFKNITGVTPTRYRADRNNTISGEK